jgi:hypothetical protein
MEVIALRDRFVDDRPVLDFIDVENHDLIDVLGEHSRGQKASYACADDCCALSKRPCPG